MLQGRPEVHCDGAYLNLHVDKLLFFGEVHRSLDNQVQTAVAVWLGVLYVVLALDELHVVLRGQEVRHGVDIVDVVAHYADACDVVQLALCVIAAERYSLAVELLKNALRGFHAVLKVMYRVVVVFRLEFVVEYLKLGLDLADRGLVEMLKLHELVELVHNALLCVRREKLLYRL